MAPAYYTWNGIRRIEPNASSLNGTLCLASGMTKTQVVDKCTAWQAGLRRPLTPPNRVQEHASAERFGAETSSCRVF